MPRKSVVDRFQREDLYFLSLLSEQDTKELFSKAAKNFAEVQVSATGSGLHLEAGGIEYRFQSVRHGQVKAESAAGVVTAVLLACQRECPHGFVVSFPDGERIQPSRVSRDMLSVRHKLSVSEASELLAKAGLVGQVSLASALRKRSGPSLMADCLNVT